MKRPETFEQLEAAVLAELISNELALGLADDLECDDFGHPFHREAFSALRDVQAASNAEQLAELHRTSTLVLAVVDRMINLAIWKRAATTGRPEDVCRDYPQEVELTTRMRDLVIGAPRYRDDFAAFFPRHLRELRAVARQRRAIWRAA